MHFFGPLRVSPVKYQKILPSEEDDVLLQNDEKRQQPPRRVRLTTVLPYAGIAVISLCLIIVSVLHARLIHATAPRPLLTCGWTISEARDRGCTFDRLTKAWLPAECPRTYEDEFLALPLSLNLSGSSWQYWTDRTFEQEIDDEQMAVFAETMPQHTDAWVSTERMHLAHCAFVLMRQADAYIDKTRIDGTSGYVPHTKHCVGMLLDAAMKAPNIDRRRAVGEVGFGAC